MNDYKIIKRFAKLFGLVDLATGTGLTALESGGFESWTKIQGFAWGLQKSFESELKIAVVYDPDYRSDEENTFHKKNLEQEVKLVHFHERKEIENYLLMPEVLARAIERAIDDRAKRTGENAVSRLNVRRTLDRITNADKETISGQYIAHYCEYFRKSGKDQGTLASEALEKFNEKWKKLESRMTIVRGKDVLRKFRAKCQERLGITLTDLRIVEAFKCVEVPNDLVVLLNELEEFREKSRGV